MSTTADWRQRVKAAQAVTRQRRAGSNRRYPMLTHIPSSPEWTALIAQCAERTGHNKSAWTRRAVSVAIARELDMDVRDVLKFCPTPKGVGRKNGRYTGDYDHGEGIEAFGWDT